MDPSHGLWTARLAVYYASYYILMPIFGICGPIGHLISLFALVKEAKKEGAYAYQIFVTISQIFESIFYVLYVLSNRWWSGIELFNAVWYQDTYFLMWYSAHLAATLQHTFITISLLLTVSVGLDRFFALYVPHSYRNWNHKRRQALAITVSVVLGVSSTVFIYWRYNIAENLDEAEGAYNIVSNAEFTSSTLWKTMSHVRNFLRMGGLLLLISCNTANWMLFRQRVLKVGPAEAGPSSTRGPSPKMRQRKREAERTLFLLATVESMMTSVAMTAITAYFWALFTNPGFSKCIGPLMQPVVDCVMHLSSSAKFYVVLTLDARFRRLIRGVFLGGNSDVSGNTPPQVRTDVLKRKP